MPLIVSSIPMTVLAVNGSVAKIRPIKAPKSGDVNAIGITLFNGAPLIAV